MWFNNNRKEIEIRYVNNEVINEEMERYRNIFKDIYSIEELNIMLNELMEINKNIKESENKILSIKPYMYKIRLSIYILYKIVK